MDMISLDIFGIVFSPCLRLIRVDQCSIHDLPSGKLT